jgi:hypothetical protein
LPLVYTSYFCTLYINLTTRPRGRPRNGWQDELREDGTVGGEEWQEKVYNREEWKKLLQRGMEEAAENGKELSHSARATGMNE